jgi:hypothetical protein
LLQVPTFQISHPAITRDRISAKYRQAVSPVIPISYCPPFLFDFKLLWIATDVTSKTLHIISQISSENGENELQQDLWEA